jgi:hypothetical protein
MSGGRRRPHSDRAPEARRPPYGRHIACIESAHAGRAVRSRPADRNLPLDFTTVPRHPGTHRAASFPKTLTLNIVRTAEIGPSPCCSGYKTRSRVPKTLTLAPAGEVSMRSPGLRSGLPQTLTYRCSAENPQSILVLTMSYKADRDRPTDPEIPHLRRSQRWPRYPAGFSNRSRKRSPLGRRKRRSRLLRPPSVVLFR